MKLLKTLKLGVVVSGMTIMLTVGVSSAEGLKVPEIVGKSISQSLTGQSGDVNKGRKTVINRKQGNCLACHALSSLANQPFHGEVGPPLDGVAKRYSEGELRLILVNSKKVFEGTIMPAFYRLSGLNRVNKKFAGKTILSAQQVEDVIAFLKTQ